MRVHHLPIDVGGHGTALARAEREIGLDSHSYSLFPSQFGHPADHELAPPGTSILMRERRRWRLLRETMANADVVHCNFGHSIAPAWVPPCPPNACTHGRMAHAAYNTYAAATEFSDLGKLRRRGKVVAVSFQGDDVRIPSFVRARGGSHSYPTMATAEEKVDEAHRRKRIATFDRHAQLIYATNPDLLHNLPDRAQFLPTPRVDPRLISPRYPQEQEADDPLIVHAPSDRGVKGTAAILDAVAELREEGLAFRFQLVEKMSHAEAMDVYGQADIVVDQLRVGWYGAFAVECMALGKPVVAHIRPDDARLLPKTFREQLPIIDATETTIKNSLRSLLEAPRSTLRKRGQEGRRFAERHHHPVHLAERLKRDYEEAMGDA